MKTMEFKNDFLSPSPSGRGARGEGSSYHRSVLLEETVDLLNPQKGGFYVDATGGGGGHSREILKRIVPEGKLIIIDRDEQAIEQSQNELKEFEGYTIYTNDNFSNLVPILSSMNIEKISGILFDLGLSSWQINSKDRGFSFMNEGPLDMRADPEQKFKAEDLLNDYPEAEIEAVIREFGEERFAKKIAESIVRSRPLKTTYDLAEAVRRSVYGNKKVDSLARTFQAVRIAVNDELDNLRKALDSCRTIVDKGGRVAVLSYHSLEDRIVKQFFKTESADCICDKRLPACVCDHKRTFKMITKKPVLPSEEEIADNSRARSAKLRVAERV